MASYPYLQNTGNLKKFLNRIQQIGVPSKVTQKYLASLGYKSTNDRRIIGVLKYVSFIDSSGNPTEPWRKYRDKSMGATVLAQAIRTSYNELFSVYPDAHRKDNEALRDFFSTHSTVGEKALGGMIKTFKALVDLADFGSSGIIETIQDQGIHPVPIKETIIKDSKGISININIELGIPATDDPKTYELFFSALKKYLLDQ